MGDHAAEEQNSEEQDRDLTHAWFMLEKAQKQNDREFVCVEWWQGLMLRIYTERSGGK